MTRPGVSAYGMNLQILSTQIAEVLLITQDYRKKPLPQHFFEPFFFLFVLILVVVVKWCTAIIFASSVICRRIRP